MSAPGRDHGQAIGLMLVATCLVVALCFGVATVSVGVVQQNRAQNAADAAALAGSVGGVSQATSAAERNGGRLTHFVLTGSAGEQTVTATVEIAGHSATARASDAP